MVSQVFYTHGAVEAGFAQASREFTHTFTIPPVHQGYIEPHASVVRIEPDGKVNLWISNKTPFVARSQFAAALDVTEERVCVNTAPIGGDFGGKGSLMDSVVCYHLAATAGRPVKMVMTYTEELLAGNPRHPAVITLRTGVDASGRIVARKAKLVFSCGAYSAFTPLHTVHGSVHAAGPYRMPNVESRSFASTPTPFPPDICARPARPRSFLGLRATWTSLPRSSALTPWISAPQYAGRRRHRSAGRKVEKNPL